MTKQPSNFGSTFSLFMGAIWLITAIATIGSGTGGAPNGLSGGPMVIMGALAYRSAKRTASPRQAASSKRNLILQAFLLVLVAFLWLGRSNLLHEVATNPLEALIVPVWIFAAYIYAKIKFRGGSGRTAG